MTAFPICSAAMPFLYLDDDKHQVFVLRIDRQEGVEVHQADAGEIKALAVRYGLPQLLTALSHDGPQAGKPRTFTHALIVEDDARSRYALQALLRRSGYGIDSAATVTEALPKLDLGPRCLILDLNLPDGDGTVLLQRIRAGNLPIKVAVTTGSNDQGLLDEMGKFNPDAVFRKPINMNEVMNWLDAAA
jgi:CheY-like chemotaxis protein